MAPLHNRRGVSYPCIHAKESWLRHVSLLLRAQSDCMRILKPQRMMISAAPAVDFHINAEIASSTPLAKTLSS